MNLLPPVQVCEEEWFPLDLRVAVPNLIVNLGMNVDDIPTKAYVIKHGLLCMPLVNVTTKPPGVPLRFSYSDTVTVKVEADVPFSGVARLYKRH